ncbi:MAG: membrane protein insertase YidC [Candidatus Omnitrophota bacterium]|nr:membrane protein insertase YidC [Candidatus Omnitrophota bacterium]
MEKRVVLASILSAIFLTIYVQSVTKLSGPGPAGQDGGVKRPSAAALAQPEKQHEPSFDESLKYIYNEDVVQIESDDMRLDVGVSSGGIRRASLKRFASHDGTSLSIGNGEYLLRPLLKDGQNTTWSALQQTSQHEVVLQATDQELRTHLLSYSISGYAITLDLKVTGYNQGGHSRGLAGVVSSWPTNFNHSADNRTEVVLLISPNGRTAKHKSFLAPLGSPKIVPRGTKRVSLAERHFCQSINVGAHDTKVTIFSIKGGGSGASIEPLSLEPTGGESPYSATIYIGPRDYFYLKSAGFHEAFPLGVLGQIGLMLLTAIRWLAKATHSYGIAIILFASLVTCATAPFTLISFKSIKKMQELKPLIEKITSKHKGNPQKANQEMMALYKEHRVSPLSGCLPMLLQLPIFLALFKALSHFVDLRGASFLWISDLSLPDRMATLPFSAPFLGNELNALPLLMAVVMYVQTKISQTGAPGADASPASKVLSGPMMSVLFGVMFYHFPSGLVLYWMTNSLVTIFLYRLAK